LLIPAVDGYPASLSKGAISIIKPILFCLAVVTVWLSLVGCGVHRKLKVTEVQPNQVEIFLDEPANNQLDLTNMKFKWISQDHPPAPAPAAQPTSGEVDLGVAGTLGGGKFLMIFEDSNYTGDPVAQTFPGQTAGIKVKNGFFPGYGQNPSVSMGVDGTHSRSFVKDEVNDVVRFGPTPRPDLFGAFNEDGSLASVKPQGTQSVSRTFSGSTPVDTDSESDWSSKVNSPAAPTGP
jgi:hypothetical protein